MVQKKVLPLLVRKEDYKFLTQNALYVKRKVWRKKGRFFLSCARQGASSWRWKSSVGPVRGTISWTDRASSVRKGLKGTEGKALTWRTETTYEAFVLDKGAINPKVQYLHGKHGRICGRYKCKGACVLPGETSQIAKCYCHREVMRRIERSQQRP